MVKQCFGVSMIRPCGRQGWEKTEGEQDSEIREQSRNIQGRMSEGKRVQRCGA